MLRGCLRGPCPAGPTAHSLNELQPLLDVRFPSLPLHQSLGREHNPSGSQRGPVTVQPPSPQRVLPHSRAHPTSQVPGGGVAGVSLRAVTCLEVYTECLNQIHSSALHTHVPLDPEFAQ